MVRPGTAEAAPTPPDSRWYGSCGAQNMWDRLSGLSCTVPEKVIGFGPWW